MAETIDPFKGFPVEGFAFLEGLKKKNDKAYFDKHRAQYDEFVVAPSRSFVVALGHELQQRVAKGFVAIPKANGSLGRINRDVRFSKDKTPYNTHLQFRFWEGADKKTAPGVGLWVSPEGVGIAVGRIEFDKPEIARFRDAIGNRTKREELDAAVAAAKKAGAKLGDPHYKKVPKGCDPDQPGADWLRWTHIGVMMKVDVPKLVHSARFTKWCGDRIVKLAPVHHWLTKHIY